MRRTDYILGITGGAGCGKSTVLRYLKEAYGAFLIECDEVARQLQAPGQPCFAPMVRLFGADIVRADGTLDRGNIAQRVFGDAALLRELNAIVHPAVKERVLELIRQFRQAGGASVPISERRKSDPEAGAAPSAQGNGKTGKKQGGRAQLIVIEAALLLDDGYDAICDEIFYVYAPQEERRRRLKESRGYTDARVDALFASQRPEESFRTLCDAVIDNSAADPAVMYAQTDQLLLARGIVK